MWSKNAAALNLVSVTKVGSIQKDAFADMALQMQHAGDFTTMPFHFLACSIEKAGNGSGDEAKLYE